MNNINAIVNSNLKTNINISNRDVVNAICLNRLQFLKEYCKYRPTDRHYIDNLMNNLQKNTFTGSHLKLERLPYNINSCISYVKDVEDEEIETLYVTLTGSGEIYTESNYKHFPNAFVDALDKLITFDEPNVDDFYKDESGNDLIFEEK